MEFLALEGIENETEVQIWDPADVSWKDTTVSADNNTLHKEQSYILLPIPTTMPNYWKLKGLLADMAKFDLELD
ncbi:hypothetical protein NLI96_g7976 [Meripilus lineatus]|uniref:Uncharacterized protein n=1 Tax=Meripilus lineatus TaxID=2056292 RepID=A0AAD5UY56_9APHY|nr:hypothetical protein NLI96_g7976 [Physisporinus lineatus]